MPKTFKFFKWSGKKAVAFFVLTVVLAVAVFSSTLAYIIVKTDGLPNAFTPPTVDVEIEGNTVTNKGDIPVYVRAAVVVTWVKDDGTTLAQAPIAGTDYTVEYNTDAGWFQASDGFWYYTDAVEAGASAGNLIKALTDNGTAPDGYELSVQVISAGIQSTPAEAVQSAWSAVQVVDGKLEVK